jgi:hypothetical protein
MDLEDILEEAVGTASMFEPIPTKEETSYATNYGYVTIPMSEVYNSRRSEMAFARVLQAEYSNLNTSLALDLLKQAYGPIIQQQLNWSVLDRAAERDEVWWITTQRWAWKRRFVNGRRRLAEAIAGQKFCNDWDCYCGREDY